MKLQQLRYVVETFRCNLNVSEAAERLFTSQPGVSKQIRLLEDELGVQIFIRSGKRMVSVTPAGRAVLDMAERVLRDVQQIKQIGNEFSVSEKGALTVAITPSLARFRLPEVAARFLQGHGEVQFQVKQGSPDEVADMVLHGEADCAISHQQPQQMGDLKRLLCERWGYGLLLPEGHDLFRLPEITLADILAYPLLTDPYLLQQHAPLGRALARADVKNCRVALASSDDDLIQTYVRLGLGIGLVDGVARQGGEGVMWRDVSHLFAPSHVQILLRNDGLLRTYMYDFFSCFAQEWTKERIDNLLYAPPADDFSI